MLIPKTVGQVLQLVLSRLLPLGIALVVLSGAYFLSQSLEPLSYDLLTRTTAASGEESPVVLVLIDDESVRLLEKQFGPLMWHDEAYIDIFNQIQHYEPSVMVLDADVQNVDRIANKMFQAYPSLVIGWDLAGLNRVSPETLPWLFSLKAGVVNNEGDDSDGIVRSHKRFVSTSLGSFPSLSVATAIEYLRVKRGERHAKMMGKTGLPLAAKNPLMTPQSISRDPLSERTWQNSFPEGLLQRKDFLIRWYQTHPTGFQNLQTSHKAIPLWRLFTPGGVPDGFLKGKIVMVGNATSVYRDHRKTPMDIRHLHVDVHATAMDNILQSEPLEKAPQWQQLLISLGLFLFVCFIQIRVRNIQNTLGITVALMALYAIIVVQQFSQDGWVLDLVTPEVFILCGLLLGSSFRILASDEEHKAMEYTLSQLVSQSVFQEIQRSGYTLQPGGQKMDITSLFIDIRNFSTLAENTPPSAVTELLNEFYTVVEKITFQHRGTVDKFMGDGILIMFGAPIPSETHAQQALDAANDILAATRELSQRWWETTGIAVEMGISINSGPAFVGFLGPIYKLEYTAIGDTVNLCVRLQNENKRFKTRIIVSEFTVQRLEKNDNLVELDKVSVRGREGQVKIYTLAAEPLNSVVSIPESRPALTNPQTEALQTMTVKPMGKSPWHTPPFGASPPMTSPLTEGDPVIEDGTHPEITP